MTTLKAGTRLRSAIGTTEVIITKGRPGAITCAGALMVPIVSSDGGQPAEVAIIDNGQQVLLGKRYQTPDGATQVLCTKQGQGTLHSDGVPMEMVTPKLLPASD